MTDMPEKTLKPCPFCGGDAEIERIGDRRVSTVIACQNCGCRLENGETFDHGSAWNTRSDIAWNEALEAAVRRCRSMAHAVRGKDDDIELAYMRAAASIRAMKREPK